jgi:hypothetical protein
MDSTRRIINWLSSRKRGSFSSDWWLSLSGTMARIIHMDLEVFCRRSWHAPASFRRFEALPEAGEVE